MTDREREAENESLRAQVAHLRLQLRLIQHHATNAIAACPIGALASLPTAPSIDVNPGGSEGMDAPESSLSASRVGPDKSK